MKKQKAVQLDLFAKPTTGKHATTVIVDDLVEPQRKIPEGSGALCFFHMKRCNEVCRAAILFGTASTTYYPICQEAAADYRRMGREVKWWDEKTRSYI